MQKRAEKYGWNTPDRIAPNVGPIVPGLPVVQSTKKQRSLEFVGWILILFGIYELGEMMKHFAAIKPTERQEEDLKRYQSARDQLMSTEMKESEKEKFSPSSLSTEESFSDDHLGNLDLIKHLLKLEKQNLSLENFEMPLIYNLMANDGVEFYVVMLYLLGGLSFALRVLYLSIRA